MLLDPSPKLFKLIFSFLMLASFSFAKAVVYSKSSETPCTLLLRFYKSSLEALNLMAFSKLSNLLSVTSLFLEYSYLLLSTSFLNLLIYSSKYSSLEFKESSNFFSSSPNPETIQTSLPSPRLESQEINFFKLLISLSNLSISTLFFIISLRASNSDSSIPDPLLLELLLI